METLKRVFKRAFPKLWGNYRDVYIEVEDNRLITEDIMVRNVGGILYLFSAGYTLRPKLRGKDYRQGFEMVSPVNKDLTCVTVPVSDQAIVELFKRYQETQNDK